MTTRRYELSLDLIEKAARYIEAHDKGTDTFGGQEICIVERK